MISTEEDIQRRCFQNELREARELEEGRHGTAQMFLFMKHYLGGCTQQLFTPELRSVQQHLSHISTVMNMISSIFHNLLILKTHSCVIWSFHPEYHRCERETCVHRQHFEGHKEFTHIILVQ